MAQPYFPVYHPGPVSNSLSAAAVSVNSKLGNRTISISAGKAKGIRKPKHLAKSVSSCTWYEAEDRNLPSVSSF